MSSAKSTCCLPRTPPDRAAAFEMAFAKAFADKELQADAAKGRLEIDPIFGEEAISSWWSSWA